MKALTQEQFDKLRAQLKKLNDEWERKLNELCDAPSIEAMKPIWEDMRQLSVLNQSIAEVMFHGDPARHEAMAREAEEARRRHGN